MRAKLKKKAKFAKLESIATACYTTDPGEFILRSVSRKGRMAKRHHRRRKDRSGSTDVSAKRAQALSHLRAASGVGAQKRLEAPVTSQSAANWRSRLRAATGNNLSDDIEAAEKQKSFRKVLLTLKTVNVGTIESAEVENPPSATKDDEKVKAPEISAKTKTEIEVTESPTTATVRAPPSISTQPPTRPAEPAGDGKPPPLPVAQSGVSLKKPYEVSSSGDHTIRQGIVQLASPLGQSPPSSLPPPPPNPPGIPGEKQEKVIDSCNNFLRKSPSTTAAVPPSLPTSSPPDKSNIVGVADVFGQSKSKNLVPAFVNAPPPPPTPETRKSVFSGAVIHAHSSDDSRQTVGSRLVAQKGNVEDKSAVDPKSLSFPKADKSEKVALSRISNADRINRLKKMREKLSRAPAVPANSVPEITKKQGRSDAVPLTPAPKAKSSTPKASKYCNGQEWRMEEKAKERIAVTKATSNTPPNTETREASDATKSRDETRVGSGTNTKNRAPSDIQIGVNANKNAENLSASYEKKKLRQNSVTRMNRLKQLREKIEANGKASSDNAKVSFQALSPRLPIESALIENTPSRPILPGANGNIRGLVEQDTKFPGSIAADVKSMSLTHMRTHRQLSFDLYDYLPIATQRSHEEEISGRTGSVAASNLFSPNPPPPPPSPTLPLSMEFEPDSSREIMEVNSRPSDIVHETYYEQGPKYWSGEPAGTESLSFDPKLLGKTEDGRQRDKFYSPRNKAQHVTDFFGSPMSVDRVDTPLETSGISDMSGDGEGELREIALMRNAWAEQHALRMAEMNQINEAVSASVKNHDKVYSRPSSNRLPLDADETILPEGVVSFDVVKSAANTYFIPKHRKEWNQHHPGYEWNKSSKGEPQCEKDTHKRRKRGISRRSPTSIDRYFHFQKGVPSGSSGRKVYEYSTTLGKKAQQDVARKRAVAAMRARKESYIRDRSRRHSTHSFSAIHSVQDLEDHFGS